MQASSNVHQTQVNATGIAFSNNASFIQRPQEILPRQYFSTLPYSINGLSMVNNQHHHKDA
jgi:hypothetical protein